MALGAAVLGGGGGGEPYVAEVALAELMRRHGPIDVVAVDELDDDDRVAPIALIGSPFAIGEKLLSLEAIDLLASESPARGPAPTAVMPYEMAGVNAIYPLAAAAHLGVPCVDADFTGRGVPGLDLTVLELDHSHPRTHLLCDSRSRWVELTTSAGFSTEQLIRPVVETMGWLAALSTSTLTPEFLAAHTLDGTLSRCLEIGTVFAELSTMNAVGVDQALRRIDGVRLAEGVVSQRVSQADTTGQRSSVTIAPDTAGEALTRIELRNEFHVVARDGIVLATIPDIIVVLARETWTPLSVEDLVPGRGVTVIALASHPRWRTPDGVRLAGPRALGHGIDYVDFAKQVAS
ncbi:hypothetical protein ASE14_02990 [Agromyces sp. Root81]|uniref:DUF917 domain-containing protein n=1 Tax=Agromyces sp. Root81 TaxID=1736601 RepID=UPI0006F9BFF6|nr:DUF917 domain-containing protein [Agromyces sp. Root81]KRC62797.1 hypothetical protein ASE14_02990 [Agromyces sp. Root81]